MLEVQPFLAAEYTRDDRSDTARSGPRDGP